MSIKATTTVFSFPFLVCFQVLYFEYLTNLYITAGLRYQNTKVTGFTSIDSLFFATISSLLFEKLSLPYQSHKNAVFSSLNWDLFESRMSALHLLNIIPIFCLITICHLQATNCTFPCQFALLKHHLYQWAKSRHRYVIPVAQSDTDHANFICVLFYIKNHLDCRAAFLCQYISTFVFRMAE